ncbi:hypothetical protein SAMN05444515_11098 [Ectothiorhodospira marina]|uniref:Uncharacterized protein n=1 Tax=Ectothiorhodospira marina TaxID=1396821 RepID=A0A1H7MY79_9GAMM|nr:hypothetical protein SAMN05444515_11098 [Ectothiorhodospira marina]
MSFPRYPGYKHHNTPKPIPQPALVTLKSGDYFFGTFAAGQVVVLPSHL